MSNALDCLIARQVAKRPFWLEFHNLTCDYASLLKQLECNFLELAKSRYSINVMLELDRQMPNSIEIRILTSTRPKTAVRNVIFTDFKLNVCELLSHVKHVPLIKEYLLELARTSNLPLSCPVLGNYIYNITNLRVSEETLPVYTQIIFFNVTLEFSDKGKKPFGTFKLSGATMPRKKVFV
uniref:Uncharacterized protein n=1 Tax=Stomoxys calcitrans TaxID=35570 RepID=A0A1I8PQQ4_STOCA